MPRDLTLAATLNVPTDPPEPLMDDDIATTEVTYHFRDYFDTNGRFDHDVEGAKRKS
jgi:hypothetical protein